MGTLTVGWTEDGKTKMSVASMVVAGSAELWVAVVLRQFRQVDGVAGQGVDLDLGLGSVLLGDGVEVARDHDQEGFDLLADVAAAELVVVVAPTAAATAAGAGVDDPNRWQPVRITHRATRPILRIRSTLPAAR